MKKDNIERKARVQMEQAKAQSEKTFGEKNVGPRRYKLYDKIKENVSLRTIDAIIIGTSVLIIGLLIVGIVTGTPPQ